MVEAFVSASSNIKPLDDRTVATCIIKPMISITTELTEAYYKFKSIYRPLPPTSKIRNS